MDTEILLFHQGFTDRVWNVADPDLDGVTVIDELGAVLPDLAVHIRDRTPWYRRKRFVELNEMGDFIGMDHASCRRAPWYFVVDLHDDDISGADCVTDKIRVDTGTHIPVTVRR